MSEVIVHGVPCCGNDDLTKDKLTAHFQKRSNGGGEVLDVIYPYRQNLGTAVIAFENNGVVQQILERDQVFENTQLRVVQKMPEQGDEEFVPFSLMRGVVSDTVIQSIQGEKKKFFTDMAKSTGVDWGTSVKNDKDYIFISGDYSKFMSAVNFMKINTGKKFD